MEKVKLPRDVADAITHLKTHHGGNETILSGLLGNANGSCIITIREFCYSPIENFDLILSALVNGYEVEETPEDKVKAHWFELMDDLKSCSPENTNRFYLDGQMRGMNKALDLLNIKIEGIN